MGNRSSSRADPVEPINPEGVLPVPPKRLSSVEDIEQKLGTKFRNLCPRTTEWFQKKNEKTLSIAIAFVPWIIMQAFFEDTLDQEDSVVAHRGEGAVVFSDASGFTALTERLAAKSNGAELLSQCLTGFFTPLIDIINAYRGDVIKFSGDALTIYFPSFDDTEHPNYNPAVPPHGTYGLPDLGPMATAVLRASACCIEIHKRLHMFDTGVDGVVLCLHIGVGCGGITILQVGGIVPPETKTERFEYVIAGSGIEQISIAEPLASNGETCLSPEAWKYAESWAIEGRSLASEPPPKCDFKILEKINPSMYTFPCVRHAAVSRDRRSEHRFRLSELKLIRRYIPSNVFKQIENDTLTYVNEMRTVSTIFISGSGVDVSTDTGAKIAHELMSDVQRVCYAHEGSLNKYLVDDKGMLFLLVYGLPPTVHTDDPVRAVLACLDIIKVFQRMNLVCKCGVTTGRNYCGVVGSARRMEYTVLGDTVNLAARLMANAESNSVLIDQTTAQRCMDETDGRAEDEHASADAPRERSKRLRREWVEINCRALPPIKVKGKSSLIPIFRPEIPEDVEACGIFEGRRVNFPWPAVSHALGGKSKLLDVSSWDPKIRLQNLLETREQRGGFLVISGETGVGKSELTEFLVMEQFDKHGALPVFGTQDKRPGSKFRPIQQLLRSILLAFRYVEKGLPILDKPAFAALADTGDQEFVSILQADLSIPGDLWYRPGDADEHRSCERGIQLVQKLLRKLVGKQPVTCVLSMRSGSNLFLQADTDEDTVVWRLARAIADMAEDTNLPHALLLVLTMQHTLSTCPSNISSIIESDAYLHLGPLSETATLEYISEYVGVEQDNIPDHLTAFVWRITQGNGLFIAETIDSLLKFGHMEVLKNAAGSPERLKCASDLESINVADWSSTAMIGDTLCMLESLEPLQTAVVKMATVFNGVFTVADLAASACSRWAGATFFDSFRLLYALNVLQERGILQRADSDEGEAFLVDKVMECFRFNNVLIRKVGCTLVLEAQKKTVKRQALIDRVLARSLPARMEELRRKKAIPHIPWYYQIDQPENTGKRGG